MPWPREDIERRSVHFSVKHFALYGSLYTATQPNIQGLRTGALA